MRNQTVLAWVSLIVWVAILPLVHRRIVPDPGRVSPIGTGMDSASEGEPLAETFVQGTRTPAEQRAIRSATPISVTAPADEAPAPPRARAHLLVHVTREDTGLACAGSPVTVCNTAGRDLAKGEADAQGDLRIDVPAGIVLRVVAVLSSAARRELRIREVWGAIADSSMVSPLDEDATGETSIVLEVPITTEYHGKLVDDELLTPIAGVTVMDDWRGLAQTDGEGEFVVRSVHKKCRPPNPMMIQVPGYCRVEHQPGFGHESSETAEKLFLHRAGVVTGIVLGAKDEPRRTCSVQVALFPEDSGLERLCPRGVFTGDDGRFVLDGVPAGVPFSIEALPGAIETNILLRAGETRDVVLHTAIAVELSGRVFDPSGALVRGGCVSIELSNAKDSARIRSDGTYYIPFAYAGRATLHAEAGVDYADVAGWLSTEVTIPVGVTEFSIDLALKPIGNISGRVVDPEGIPVVGALVFLKGEHAQEETKIETVNNGSFSIEDLNAGDYFLRGSTADMRVRGPLVRAAPGQSNIELRLPATGSIRGRVVDPAGIDSESLDVHMWREGDDDRDVTVESDGSFTAPIVPEGAWSVQAFENGRATSIAKLTVHGGEESHAADLVLEECGVLRILAQHDLRGASVEVLRGSDEFVRQPLRQHDSDAIVVPTGDLVVLVHGRFREERYEIHIRAGDDSVLEVLKDRR